MATINEILNFAIPALLVVIVLAWLWAKMGHIIGPFFAKMWDGAKGVPSVTINKSKEIVYE